MIATLKSSYALNGNSIKCKQKRPQEANDSEDELFVQKAKKLMAQLYIK
jgi:hypothetical protein